MTPAPATPPLPPIQSTRAAVLIPFGIVTLIWGSTWLVIRDQIAVVPPSWSISYRFLVAGIAMAIYASIKRESFRFDARGFDFYDWAAGEIRLVTAWDSPADAVGLLADAIREL